jgi:hypothetical protein
MDPQHCLLERLASYLKLETEGGFGFGMYPIKLLWTVNSEI